MPRIFILGFEDLVGEILECIQGEESFSVVGIFSEPPSPWKVLELHPDAGILQALGLRAIEFARQLASFAPPPGLVFLSPWDHPALHESLARLPKARLLLTPFNAQDLARAIREVASEKSELLFTTQPEKRPAIPGPTKMEGKSFPSLPPSLHRLTHCELELLFLRSRGLSLKEIAQKWRITEGRIKNLSHRLLEKTGCRSIVQALALLLEAGVSAKPPPPGAAG